MDSPSEVKPGRIKPAVQDDPRIPPLPTAHGIQSLGEPGHAL